MEAATSAAMTRFPLPYTAGIWQEIVEQNHHIAAAAKFLGFVPGTGASPAEMTGMP